MDSFVHLLNVWGPRAAEFAWTSFWQSSLLVAVLGIADLGLRRRARPALRYALWMLVPLKLLLPPSLALPTGLGYWIPRPLPNSEATVTPTRWVTRDLPNTTSPSRTYESDLSALPVQRVPLSRSGFGLLVWLGGMLVLGTVVGRQTLQRRRERHAANDIPESLAQALSVWKTETGFDRPLEVNWIPEDQSPGLCGLWRPTLLLPRGLPDKLTLEQLRGVVLHELIHAKRGDLWINTLQVGLQILWWWHPLVWLANRTLRTSREEVVDQEVAFRMGTDSTSYPEALLQVARSVVFHPATSLGVLGIVHSRSALRSRVERLLADRPVGLPRLRAGHFLGFTFVALILLPMARGGPDVASENADPTPDLGAVTAVEVNLKAVPDSRPEPRSHPASRVATNASGLPFVVFHRRTPDPWTGQLSPPAQVPWEGSLVGNRFPPWESGDLHTGLNAEDVRSALITRTYRLNFAVLIPALEKRLGRDLGEDFSAWSAGLRDVLERAGFSMNPPNTLHMTYRTGFLMLRGPAAQVASAASVIHELSALPQQIAIDTHFVEVSPEAFQELPLGPEWNDPGINDAGKGRNPARVRVLPEAQAMEFLSLARNRKDARILGSPRMTTLSERAAEIRQTESVTNSPTSLSVQVLPQVLDSGELIRLDSVVGWTQLVDLRAPKPDAQPGNASRLLDSSGATFSVNAQGYVNHSLTNSIVLCDGCTQVVGDLNSDGPAFGRNRVIVLVTATRIDPAGNRIRKEVPKTP
ncbi:MAG: M56 family metallopeptidase [Limisphaerales bacterium]